MKDEEGEEGEEEIEEERESIKLSRGCCLKVSMKEGESKSRH